MIELASVAKLLGWSLLINILILLFVTVVMVSARSFVVAIHSKILGLGEEELLLVYANYLSQYKIAVLVFNLSPYCALRIMGY